MSDEVHRGRTLLIGLTLFLGVSAFGGGLGLLTGWISMNQSYLDGSPFIDFTIPGLALMLLVGGSALLATWLLLREHETALAAAAFSGLMIVGFEVVEILAIGFHWLQPVYLLVGITIVALAGYRLTRLSRTLAMR